MGSDRIDDTLWWLQAGEFNQVSEILLGRVDRRCLSSDFMSALILLSENFEARVGNRPLTGLELVTGGEQLASEGDFLGAAFGLLLTGIMDSLRLLSSAAPVEELRSRTLMTD